MEINYSIFAPSIIKLSSFVKCFDIDKELLALGYKIVLKTDYIMERSLFSIGQMRSNFQRTLKIQMIRNRLSVSNSMNS